MSYRKIDLVFKAQATVLELELQVLFKACCEF